MRSIIFIIIFLVFGFACQTPKRNVKSTEMNSEWNKFKAFLKSELPVYAERLSKGSDKTSIQALQNKLNIELPDEFKDLYLENNGEDTLWFAGGAMCGMKILTLKEIEKEWLMLNSLENKFQFNSKWRGSIHPSMAIRKEAFNKKWIPVFSDRNGNYLGIDLAPDVNGKMGQIINFGRDENNHYIFANSLHDFIALINHQIENGTAKKAIFQNESGQSVMFGLYKESHLIDDLKSLK